MPIAQSVLFSQFAFIRDRLAASYAVCCSNWGKSRTKTLKSQLIPFTAME